MIHAEIQLFHEKLLIVFNAVDIQCNKTTQ